MNIRSFFAKQSSLSAEIADYLVFLLLVLSALWRGGKTLEMTWLLTGVASIVTAIWFFHHREAKDQPEDALRIPLYLWCTAMLYVVLTVVSYLTSTVGNYGFDEVLRTASLVLLFFWVARRSHASHGEDFLQMLVRILAIVTLAACTVGVFVYAFQPVNRFVGTFFDHRFHTDYWPNAWAEFLLLTWPLVGYWTVYHSEREHRTLSSRLELLLRSSIFGFVLGAIFLTFSRGAVLSLIAQFFLLGGFVYYRLRRDVPWKNIVPTAVLVCAVTLLTFHAVNAFRANNYEVQRVAEKVTFTADEGTLSVSDRFSFWGDALTFAEQKPVFGWGPYSFRFIQPQRQTSVLSTSDHAHNVFLKIAMERGMPAAALLFALLCTVLVAVGRVVFQEEYSLKQPSSVLVVLIAVSVAGVLLHNFIDYNLQFVGIAAPLWVFLGVLLARGSTGFRLRTPWKVALGAEMLVAVLLLGFAFYEGVYLTLSSYGRHAEIREDYEAAARWYNLSKGEIFTRDLYLSSAIVALELDDAETAESSITKYVEQNDQDARAWKLYGDIAHKNEQHELAFTLYKKAYDRARYNDLSTVSGLLDALIALEREEEIDAYKPEIDALLEAHAEAISFNTHWSALSHNVEQYIVISNTLAALYPDDAPGYQVAAAKVDHHAQLERERLSSRPPGFLW